MTIWNETMKDYEGSKLWLVEEKLGLRRRELRQYTIRGGHIAAHILYDVDNTFEKHLINLPLF